MERAARGGGQTKALAVGIILWRLALMNGFNGLRIPKKDRESMGMERHTFYRALDRLEQLGLIEAHKKRGAITTIDLIDEVINEQISN